MRLVVDANILISAFIKDSHTRRLLVLQGHDLAIPEYALIEIKNHLPEILKKAGLQDENIPPLLFDMLSASRIKIIPEKEFIEFFPKAKLVTPDPDDTQYFALAMHLGCGIWSNDKALQSQQKIRIYTTEEITNLGDDAYSNQ